MASAWGKAWGKAWGNAWGKIASEIISERNDGGIVKLNRLTESIREAERKRREEELERLRLEQLISQQIAASLHSEYVAKQVFINDIIPKIGQQLAENAQETTLKVGRKPLSLAQEYTVSKIAVDKMLDGLSGQDLISQDEQDELKMILTILALFD